MRRGPTTTLLVLLTLVVTVSAAAAQGATGGATGTVRTPGGAGIDAVVVQLRDASCAPDEQCPSTYETTTDSAGDWSVAGVAIGQYIVAAHDPAHRYVDTRLQDPIEVQPGATTQDVDITMPRAGALAGTVSSAAGGPATDAEVAIERDGVEVARRMPGKAGDYRFEGLRAGTYVLIVAPEGERYHRVETTVEIGAGTVTTADVVAMPEDPIVERDAGASRIETAVRVSQRAFADGAESVVIATASTFPDALAAAPLAGDIDGPVLLVADRLDPLVTAELARLSATRAVIVGGSEVVSVLVQSELELLGLEVERIAGEARDDTAALTARRVGLGPTDEIVVAYGWGFADALSVAPLAARQGIPILLTATDVLSADSAAAITALGPGSTIVVGGRAVVADAVLHALPDPTRVAGLERYATSAAIAELSLARDGDLTTVYVATGANFPDALTGGPAAARLRAPLLLVDGADPRASAATWSFLDEHARSVARVVVLGGTDAVSSAVTAALRRIGEGP